jgi:hypothetical protein
MRIDYETSALKQEPAPVTVIIPFFSPIFHARPRQCRKGGKDKEFLKK